MIRYLDELLNRQQMATRRKKLRDFYRLCRPTPEDRILDVGESGADSGWAPLNILLRVYEHPESLAVLGVDDYSRLREKHPDVRFVTYSGGHFPFVDDSFDICYSNAVIEHVGEYEDQRQFIDEMVRVAHQGFFTTPNRWLLLEVHTRLPMVHYLPGRYFWRIAQAFGRGDSARGVNLIRPGLLKKMMRCSQVKHFTIIPNRVWGMTATYSVYWTRS